MPPDPPGRPMLRDQAEGAGAGADGGRRSRSAPEGPPPGRRRRRGTIRARKVHRVVRHIDPWSVLRVSLLFFVAVFLVISVASALLWNAGRSAGVIDDVEGFITSVGGFGNCEPIDGDQLDPGAAGTSTTVSPAEDPEPIDDDEDCPEGQHLVGEFTFEGSRILVAFLLGGGVLVLAGSATAVVVVLLFNLISELTGGVRVTVLEEPPSRPRAGSPPGRPPG